MVTMADGTHMLCVFNTHPRYADFKRMLDESLVAPAPAPASQSAPPPQVDAGLAVLDAAGVEIVAERRNASDEYLAGLRLLGTKDDLSEQDLLAAIGSATLAGHQAATTKRVKRALGGRSARLFHVRNGRIVIAPQTREALRRHFALDTPSR